MFATFSTETKILTFLREAKTSTVFLSVLAELRGPIPGSSQSMLSQMQRGRALEASTAREMDALINELNELKKLCEPIPVRFDDARAIDNLLTLLEKKVLQVVIFENQEKQDQ